MSVDEIERLFCRYAYVNSTSDGLNKDSFIMLLLQLPLTFLLNFCTVREQGWVVLCVEVVVV